MRVDFTFQWYNITVNKMIVYDIPIRLPYLPNFVQNSLQFSKFNTEFCTKISPTNWTKNNSP